METRANALAQDARGAKTREARETALTALNDACAGFEDTTSLVGRVSAWARAMMSKTVPTEARLRFALEADAVQRVAFANTFDVLEDEGIDWKTLTGCVEPKEFAPTVTEQNLYQMLDMIANAGLRKAISSPSVAAFCDFR